MLCKPRYTDQTGENETSVETTVSGWITGVLISKIKLCHYNTISNLHKKGEKQCQHERYDDSFGSFLSFLHANCSTDNCIVWALTFTVAIIHLNTPVKGFFILYIMFLCEKFCSNSI